jgi:hypothetical protein
MEKCKLYMNVKHEMSRNPFLKGSGGGDLLTILHSDICSPLSVDTHEKKSYLITFIDDYSRYGYAYLIFRKSEVLEKLKEYRYEVKGLLGRKIKVIRLDRGGEYNCDEFNTFFYDNHITCNTTMTPLNRIV